MLRDLQTLFFLLLLVVAWLELLWSVAALGGLEFLAKKYALPADVEIKPTERFRLRSLQLRRSAFVQTNYHSHDHRPHLERSFPGSAVRDASRPA